MKKFLFISILAFICIDEIKAQYNLEFNESEYLRIPDPPYNGYVASANWNVNNSNLSFNVADEAGAIIYPNHYFEGSSLVTCSYRYEYYRNGRSQSGMSSVSYTVSFKSNHATLDKTELLLSVDQSEKLSYTLERSYGSVYGSPKMSWESSNENVATVDKNGKVTAVGSGYAKISFDPVVGPPVYCDVTVQYIAPTSISFKESNVSVAEGKTKTLSYTLAPKGASATVKWSSSNESIVKVSSIGKITGVAEGNATVTVTTENGLSATCSVNVVSAPKSVSLPSSTEVVQGYTTLLKPTLTPVNSETTYKWKTDDTSIATVASNGKVTGKNIGTATITVTTENGLTATCKVIVKDAPQGADYRNAKIRVKTVKDLVDETLKYIDK